MSEWTCKECGEKFGSKRGLHLHMKKHFDRIGDYYTKHYAKQDLFTGEPIPFKNYDQYFADNFTSLDNYMKWVKTAPKNQVKEYILKKFKEKIDHKELKYMPPSSFYDLYELANRVTIENVWGDYNEFCKEVGLQNPFNDTLPHGFWQDNPEDMKILIDTREQRPLNFSNGVSHKLDFGDYAAAGEHFSPTFVDRKSEDDFRSTFGRDHERFRREMDRCVKFDSYMFVVVESTLAQVEINNRSNPFRSNLAFVWHNVRDMIAKYPNNLQFIFAHNRAGAKKIIPKILYHGKTLWDVDVQYHLEKRIYEKSHA